jgi:hypothetical protein
LQGSKGETPCRVAVDDELHGPVAQVAHPIEKHNAAASFHTRKECTKDKE